MAIPESRQLDFDSGMARLRTAELGGYVFGDVFAGGEEIRHRHDRLRAEFDAALYRLVDVGLGEFEKCGQHRVEFVGLEFIDALRQPSNLIVRRGLTAAVGD